MADPVRIVVRADASASIGLGHAVRSATLAASLAKRGAQVDLVGAGITSIESADICGRVGLLALEPGQCVDRADAIIELRPDLVIVDGYHFGRSLFDELGEAGIGYVVIDDNAETTAPAPLVVLNPNPHATPEHYAHLPSNAQLLLGIDFALVRSTFDRIAANPPERDPGVVFVAMGGSDPLRLTEPLVHALAAHDHSVRVAVGSAHPDRDDCRSRLGRLDRVEVVAPTHYETALASSELAVLAAGSSVWEAAVVGTPVVCVVVADNQAAPAAAARAQSLVLDCLDARDAGSDIADEIRRRVDDALHTNRTTPCAFLSNGADRAARAILEATDFDTTSGRESVELRPAVVDDTEFLMELRNDQAVVKASRVDEPVRRAAHERWVHDSLSRPDRRLFVICVDDVPVGQARLDQVDDDEVVSIALHPDHRGLGHGGRALRAIQAVAHDSLIAEVREENDSSLALFRRAGFDLTGRSSDGFLRLRWSAPASEGFANR